MSIKNRLVVLNALRNAAGKAPLKAWKQAAKKLEEQIAKFQSKVREDDGGEEEQHSKIARFPIGGEPPIKNRVVSAPKLRVPRKGSKVTPDPVQHGRRDGIGAIIKPLIHNGLSNKEIFDLVMKDHPNLLCTLVDGKMKPTKKWYIAWYRGDLRRKGLLPSTD